MFRIGVLGAGWHAFSDHGPPLRDYAARHAGAVELAAVCDLDEAKARRFAESYGVARVYTSLETMLTWESLNALLAITPLPLTASLVAGLLPRGIPLLIEKPPGRTGAEARDLLRAARASGTPHMVSFNRRFHPAVARARAWLAAHPTFLQIGVSARMLRHNRREPDFITGTGIHAVDTVLSFVGRPETVTSLRTPGNDGASCFAWVRSTSGAIGTLAIAPNCGVMEETYEVLGRDFRIWIDAHACRLCIECQGRVEVEWQAPEQAPATFRDGTEGETESFLDALREGRRPAPDLEDGLISLLTAEAMTRDGETRLEPENR
ncbi:MAG: Gfo/Idh/MocA family oxidoreductase [Lentisphaerae bacterium]|nr:Gfo/Idh/MocA family oxidoreductase [Lentisphaerota bacterium]